jgi:hypothetical protein
MLAYIGSTIQYIVYANWQKHASIWYSLECNIFRRHQSKSCILTVILPPPSAPSLQYTTQLYLKKFLGVKSSEGSTASALTAKSGWFVNDPILVYCCFAHVYYHFFICLCKFSNWFNACIHIPMICICRTLLFYFFYF